MNWKPIDTAPKDGSEILVWDATNYGDGPVGVTLVAWREFRYRFPNEPWQYAWCVPGSDQDELGGCATADNPTHWMPLPEPPK